jgi:hypothetical protein
MSEVVLKSGDLSVSFSKPAVENIEESNLDWGEGLLALQSGRMDPESLLQNCLEGSDEDRTQGWRDYVTNLTSASKQPLRAEVEGDYRLAWDASGYGRRG